jgi:uncharacterized protein (DUF1778 family)
LPPNSRTRNITATVTESEYQLIVSLAAKKKRSISAFVHDSLFELLNETHASAADPTAVLLAEVIALRETVVTLLFNLSQGVGADGQLTAQAIQQLVERIDKRSHAAAMDKLKGESHEN